MLAVYCNCFSTPGPSFTICPSREVRAGLQLGKQFCSSFIPLIPHLHIHQELPETPQPQPPPKLLLGGSLDPSAAPGRCGEHTVAPASCDRAGGQWGHPRPGQAQRGAATPAASSKTSSKHHCPDKLCLPQPCKCPGLGAVWHRGRCPCTWWGVEPDVL